MAKITLNGSEKTLAVLGRYVSIKNNSSTTVYASNVGNIDISSTNVTPIQPGESVVIPNCDKAVYVVGTGQIAIESDNRPFNFFKPAPANGGSGGTGEGITLEQLNAALDPYDTIVSVDNKLKDKVDVRDGYGLSQNDYSDKDKAKLNKLSDYISNPNLLDNPDFKINQRGKTEYVKNTSTFYTVDRWRAQNGFKVSIVDNGITIAPTSTTTQGLIMVLQNIPRDTSVKGPLTLSISAETNSNSIYAKIYTRSDTADLTQSESVYLKTGMNTVTLNTIPDEATQIRVGIAAMPGATVNDSATLNWVKLEIGDTATPFVAPNPTLELLKCQRYCIALVSDNARSYNMNANILYFQLPLSVPLRVAPTAETDVNPLIKLYASGTTFDDFVFNYNVIQNSLPILRISATKSAHGINENGGIFMAPPNERLILSADL